MFKEKDLHRISKTLRWLISQSLYMKLYDSCIAYMRCLANLYYTFNIKYADIELERHIKFLSEKITATEHIKQSANTCVFYDDFSMDNRGLTQQYIEALIKLKYKIIYIYPLASTNNKQILDTLKAGANNNIISIKKNLSGVKLAQYIYDVIQRSGASILFTQILPYSVEACMAFCKLDQCIKKYNINLTDHAFNLGISYIDSNLEFRNFGAVVSVNHRGITLDKEVLLPMYPIFNESHQFEGLPSICKDKVIVLTGGAPYKILDESEMFFKLVKMLLHDPKVVVVYVGCNNKELFERHITKYDLNDRFVVIGDRKDIYEVIKHCDIYMNTYPIGGGLMCQIAASCGKPIINYRVNPRMEECVCQIHNVEMSYDTIDDFCQEACHLINDAEYRIQRGQAFRNSITSASQFCEMLDCFLKKAHGIVPINYSKTYIYDGTEDMKSAIVREDCSMIYHKYLCKKLKFRIIFFPSVIWRLFSCVIMG